MKCFYSKRKLHCVTSAFEKKAEKRRKRKKYHFIEIYNSVCDSEGEGYKKMKREREGERERERERERESEREKQTNRQ